MKRMYLLSRLQKKAGIGRLVSAVMGLAAEKGSSVRFTQMLRVFLKGLENAMYAPSGEIWAPLISGSPKKSSRSRSGGCWAASRPPKPRRRRRSWHKNRFIEIFL